MKMLFMNRKSFTIVSEKVILFFVPVVMVKSVENILLCIFTYVMIKNKKSICKECIWYNNNIL